MKLGYTEYLYYIDAIGFSWESYYTVGDNLYEGLLVSFKLHRSFPWIKNMNYSLDQSIVAKTASVLGDIVIPMPDEGSHTIQISGNDTFGIMYRSKTVYFLIDTISPTINIISPIDLSTINTTSLSYIVEIFDIHLDKMWYTINSTTTKYFFTNNGTIQGWVNFTNEPHTITFYANDTLGNISSEYITAIKEIPPTNGDGERGIPGYGIMLFYATFLTLLCFILVLSRKKRELKII